MKACHFSWPGSTRCINSKMKLSACFLIANCSTSEDVRHGLCISLRHPLLEGFVPVSSCRAPGASFQRRCSHQFPKHLPSTITTPPSLPPNSSHHPIPGDTCPPWILSVILSRMYRSTKSRLPCGKLKMVSSRPGRSSPPTDSRSFAN